MAKRPSIDDNRNLQDFGQTLKSGYHPHEVFLLPVSQLRPSKQQPRRESENRNLEALCASIERYGLLQPITVHPNSDKDIYDLISGHRRLLAYQHLGRDTIPAIIRRDVSERERFELAVMENENREDLNPVERVYAVLGLIQRHLEVSDEALEKTVLELRAKARHNADDVKVKEVQALLQAVGIGNIGSFYANHLRILRLPSEVLRLVRDHDLSPGSALQLLPLLDHSDELVSLAHKAVQEALTVRNLRTQVEERLAALTLVQKEARGERGQRYGEHSQRMARGMRVLRRELGTLEGAPRPDLDDTKILEELEAFNKRLEKLLRLLKH